MLISLSDLFQKYHINPTGVIHIGASTGQEADTYHSHGLKVIWVEAIREVYKQLCRNVVKYAGTICINACVSDKDGEMVNFNISNNEGQSSSMLDFDTHTKEHPGVVFTHSTTLHTLTVRSILKERQIDPEQYDFLNLDIQGAELLALKGTDLSYIRYIYIEVNEKHLYKDCPLLPEIDEYLKQFDFERVETKMTGWGWGDAFYIKKHRVVNNMQFVPDQFRIAHPFHYPPDNDIEFERWYYMHHTTIEGRTYLPVMWTAYYCMADKHTSQRAGKIASLQKFLNDLDKTKRYYTIVQYDDGILNDLSHLDIKVFSMSGKPMDYCLPLLCKPHPVQPAFERTIYASFMGRITHPVRAELMKIKQPGWLITDQVQKMPQFCSILARSVFTLCPRGYGCNSFRIAESIQFGSIPVYISDVFAEGHGIPFEQYGIKIPLDKVNEITSILNAVPPDEVREKQSKLPYIFETYFSYQGNKKLIDANINGAS
jgi:FkbM family methyltransferase